MSDNDYQFEIPDYYALLTWNMEHNFYPMVDPRGGETVDYHRLQLEYWLFRQQPYMGAGPILDVGAEYHRGIYWNPVTTHPTYTLNSGIYDTPYGMCLPEILGTVEDLPIESASIATVICTETIEHVKYPHAAVSEMGRVLKPNGLLLLTTPFLWQEHGDNNFNDYWRWTEDGLRLLLEQSAMGDLIVEEVRPTLLRSSAKSAVHLVRDLEVMDQARRWPSGFLLKARKKSKGQKTSE